LFCFVFFCYYYSYNLIRRRRHSFRDEILIDSKYFPSLRLTDIAQMPHYGWGSVIIVKRIRIRRFARFRFYIQCKCAGRTTKQQRGKWLKFDTFFSTLFYKIYIYFLCITPSTLWYVNRPQKYVQVISLQRTTTMRWYNILCIGMLICRCVSHLTVDKISITIIAWDM